MLIWVNCPLDTFKKFQSGKIASCVSEKLHKPMLKIFKKTSPVTVDLVIKTYYLKHTFLYFIRESRLIELLYFSQLVSLLRLCLSNDLAPGPYRFPSETKIQITHFWLRISPKLTTFLGEHPIFIQYSWFSTFIQNTRAQQIWSR